LLHPGADGILTRIVRGACASAARRPRTTIALWFALVVVCVTAGSLTGTKELGQSGVGQSARASAQLSAARLNQPSVEDVLIESGSAHETRAATRALEARLRDLAAVASIDGPSQSAALSRDRGRVSLVQATLSPNATATTVTRAVASVRASYPRTSLRESGDSSQQEQAEGEVANVLGTAALVSIPLTLVILLLAFGSVVAALVPLGLALTTVGAALGGLSVLSQIAPNYSSTSSVVLLIGLAVGVDYSLFYIRRERAERAAGATSRAALDIASATAGRAILVSGTTVVLALGGLLLTGSAIFTSIALGAMLVASIAIVGSLTVLPATLALLGDRIERWRLPWRRRPRGRSRGWRAVAGTVTGSPAVALLTAVCLLGALAVPAAGMHTLQPADGSDFPSSLSAVAAEHAIEREFPGAVVPGDVVVTGHSLGTPTARHALAALGRAAIHATGGQGRVAVTVAGNGHTALVAVPMPIAGGAATHALDALRTQIAPLAGRLLPGAHALVTGDVAGNADFSQQLGSATVPIVAIVLALAFLLLLATFRSVWLASTVIALSLLSVTAAYGVMVAVFQHHWAQRLLGFTSIGAIISWIPLFLFVILFGLSMDYTVLMLERVREGRRAGLDPRAAAAEALVNTGGTVTSAAIVMVAVFAVFALLPTLDFKEMGVGLSVAILLDATIVRGIALPAAITLIGERWRVHPRADADERALGECDDVAPTFEAMSSMSNGR
jgi:RND superfamily putative drug exporter